MEQSAGELEEAHPLQMMREYNEALLEMDRLKIALNFIDLGCE